MRFILPTLLLALFSQAALAQTTVRMETVQVTPEEEAPGAQRVVRRLVAVVRTCFDRGGEGHGGGRIVLRAALEHGRVTNMRVVSTVGTPSANAVACTIQGLRSRIRVPAESPIRELVIPIRFEYPELALPANAMSDARAARRRGRCMVDAANQLIAAIRAFERTRGRARARAHARVEAARAALNACGGLLQGVIGQGVVQGQGVSTDPCPHCRLESSTDAN